MKPDIDIVCPKCNAKAGFFASSLTVNTLVVPDSKGKVVCLTCGLNKVHGFSQEDYYYSIPVGNRFLYARNKENLEVLLQYFKEDKRLESDPELDFPKAFYQNRLHVVKQIEKRIADELKDGC